MMEQEEFYEALVRAVRRVAEGDDHGPGGLEGLAMAFAGEGLRDSLCAAVRESNQAIADALNDVSASLDDIAKALGNKS